MGCAVRGDRLPERDESTSAAQAALWWGQFANNDPELTGVGNLGLPGWDNCTVSYLGNFDDYVHPGSGKRYSAGPVAITAAHCAGAWGLCGRRYRSGDLSVTFWDAGHNVPDTVRVDAIQWPPGLLADTNATLHCSPYMCAQGRIAGRGDPAQDLLLLHLERPPQPWVERLRIVIADDPSENGWGHYNLNLSVTNPGGWLKQERRVMFVGYGAGSNNQLYTTPHAPGDDAGGPLVGQRFKGWTFLQPNDTEEFGAAHTETQAFGCFPFFKYGPYWVTEMMASLNHAKQGPQLGAALDGGDSGGPLLVRLGQDVQCGACNGDAGRLAILGLLGGGDQPPPSAGPNGSTVYPDPSLYHRNYFTETWLPTNGVFLERMLMSGDWDGDGVAGGPTMDNEADNCPGHPDFSRRDMNKDVEDELYALNTPQNPRFPKPRGDKCDVAATAGSSLASRDLPLNYGHAPCEKVKHTFPATQCPLRINSEIHFDARFTPAYDFQTSAKGTVGFRFCKCDLFDTKTEAGRRDCARHAFYNCAMTGNLFDPFPPDPYWLLPRTDTVVDNRYGADFIPGKGVPLAADWGVLNPAEFAKVSDPSAQAHPWPWTEADLPDPNDPAKDWYITRGVLWTHVHEFALFDWHLLGNFGPLERTDIVPSNAAVFYPQDSINDFTLADYSRVFGSGDIRLRRGVFVSAAIQLDVNLPDIPYIAAGCTWCKYWGNYQVWAAATDTTPGSEIVYGHGLDGPQPMTDLLSPSARTLLSKATTGAARFIPASEAAFWHSRGPASLLGAALEPTSGAVQDSLAISGSSYVALGPGGWGCRTCDPVVYGAKAQQSMGTADAYALAGTRQELYAMRFGRGGGAATLERYAFAAQRWSEIPMSGQELPRKPLALTYRPEDQALYAVDRHGVRIRLWRIALDGATRQIAWSWWNPQRDRISLGSGDDGHLLLVTSGRGEATFTRAIRLRVGADGTVSPDGQALFPGRLFATPVLSERGVELATARHREVQFRIATERDLTSCGSLESFDSL
jgi:hypothetical protein